MLKSLIVLLSVLFLLVELFDPTDPFVRADFAKKAQNYSFGKDCQKSHCGPLKSKTGNSSKPIKLVTHGHAADLIAKFELLPQIGFRLLNDFSIYYTLRPPRHPPQRPPIYLPS